MSEVQVRAVACSGAHSFGPLALPQRQFNRQLFLQQLREREPGGDCVQVPKQLSDCNPGVADFNTTGGAARDTRPRRRVALSHVMRSAQSSKSSAEVSSLRV